ncbi:hypothetical protein BH23VER1_BH23VER1_14330 [soil metagenome]
MKKPLLLCVAVLCSGLALTTAQEPAAPTIEPADESEELPPDEAVVEDPVPAAIDPTPLDQVPPPIPVTDPAQRLKLLHKEAKSPVDLDLNAAIKSMPELSMFAQLVAAAGAELTLSQGGPHTVFAPTNDAFAELPDAIRQNLLSGRRSNAAKAVLQRHLIENVVSYKDLESVDLETAGGNDLKIKVDDDTDSVMIDAGRLVKGDLVTRNGVLHLIDKVLILPSE